MMQKRIILLVVSSLMLISLSGCQHDSDQSSPTAQQTVQIRYAAVGASDAIGTCANPMLENGYVYRIRDGLATRSDQVAFKNLGILGARIDVIETLELPAAIQFQPTLVTIWVGGNDFMAQTPAAAFEAALANLLTQLRAQTSAQIVIGNLPDMRQLPRVQAQNWDPGQTQALIEEYNAAIARQAAQAGAHLVDLHAADLVSNPANICQDGFHPSNDGYARMAELFLNVIHALF